MSIKNKNFVFVIILLLFGSLFHSCVKEVELIPKIEGIPGGGILDAEIKSINGNLVNFRLDLFAVNHYGNFIENLDGNCFSSPNDDLEITAIEVGTPVNKGAYSVMLLFDQSGSIEDTDPNDARIDAGKAFVGILGDGDEAGVSVFAGSGWTVLSDFSTDQDKLSDFIESMRGNTGGGTPLYYSIYGLIDEVAQNAKNENKAIIVFTDGEDTDGGSIQNIIDYASQLGVQIFTIGLGNVVNYQDLTEIALGTGGAVMLAQDALQLIALYNSLSDLLHGDGTYYETCWQAKKLDGTNWISGDIIITDLQLTLPTGEAINYPIRIKIP
ncbi:MAG: hypothetical protein ACI85O_001017 [Saprospiraceae bacterium]|jgi:hypothetical protein